MSIPAAWHPDPTGRHEYRYWDGQRWTEHVANAGQRAVDPIDGRPAEQASQTTTGGQAAADGATQQAAPQASELPASTTPTEPGADTAEDRAYATPQPQTPSTPPAAADDPASSATTDAAGAPSGFDPRALGPDGRVVPLQDRSDESTPRTGQDDETTAAAESPVAPAGVTAAGQRPPAAPEGDASAPMFQPADEPPPDAVFDWGADDPSDAATEPSQSKRRKREHRDSLGNGPAVAAMILGVVAILLAFVPFLGLIALPLGIVAVILGVIGRRRGRLSGIGRGTATTGLATGALGGVLAVAITMVFIGVVRESAFGVAELAACIDQGIDARTCSRRFEQAFLDQLLRR